jgi:SAM-dependent methyltransferase
VSGFFFFIMISLLRKTPAIFALSLQVVSVLVLLVFFQIFLILSAQFSFQIQEIPFSTFVLAQAILANLVAHYFQVAPWWRWIHFIFPIALWVTLQFEVPNEIYLVGFLLTLSVFWSTYRTQVPYYPSRVDVWQRMDDFVKQFALEQQRLPKVIDIGSGLGGLSLHLAKHHQLHIEGIEIAPLPWLVSRLRAMISQSQAKFILGDYQHLDFVNYDIVFAYLSPAAMPALWEKANKEMRKNSRLISLEFEVPNVMPQSRLPQKGQNRELFIYQL